jgi:hypothetical protein
MLRVTPIQTRRVATLKLEGKLAGPWVDELRGCWASLARNNVSVRINLRDVSYVDRLGRDLLLRMERQGTPLLECSEFLGELLHPDGRRQAKRRKTTVKKENSHARTLRP